MGYGTYNAIGKLSVLLFLGVIVLGINIGQTHPTAVSVTGILLLMFGILTCIYGLRGVQKYKDVFDFEPVTFWGKQRNGKYTRQVFTAFTSVGMWSSIAGLALMMIRL